MHGPLNVKFIFFPLLSFFQTHLFVYPIISLSCPFLPYSYPFPSIFRSYRHSAFLFFVLNHSVLKIFFDSFEPSEYLCPPPSPSHSVAIILSILPLVRFLVIPFPEVWQWRRRFKFFFSSVS